MGSISARIPDDLESELEAFLEAENVDRSTAVRMLLTNALEEWRRERALEELEAGRVSFARAAELADTSVWDIARLARDRDATLMSGDHVEADLEEFGVPGTERDADDTDRAER